MDDHLCTRTVSYDVDAPATWGMRTLTVGSSMRMRRCANRRCVTEDVKQCDHLFIRVVGQGLEMGSQLLKGRGTTPMRGSYGGWPCL